VRGSAENYRGSGLCGAFATLTRHCTPQSAARSIPPREDAARWGGRAVSPAPGGAVIQPQLVRTILMMIIIVSRNGHD
jgi:hypothetical protein